MSQVENKSDIEKKDIKNFEFLLQKKFGSKLKVLDYKVSNLVSFGENFAGGLLKIDANIKFTENSPIETLNLVGKTIVSSEEGMDWTIFLEKETFMYDAIVPFYARVELESNDKNYQRVMKHLLPKLYGYRLSLDSGKKEADDDCVILLENLKNQGYYVLGKQSGLDLEHAEKAIQILAKFHAFGIATKIKYPKEFEKFKSMANKTGYKYDDNQMTLIYNNLINWIKSIPSFSKYVPNVEKAMELRRKLGRNYEPLRHKTWSTIVHMDYWTNNLLFHKDESGKVDDLKIIDFQGYSFADIFLDLYYFMCTSLDNQVKIDNFDDLLDLYYDTFIATLKRVNIEGEVYSRNNFDARMKEIAGYQFFHCIFALSFFTCKSESNDREDLMIKICSFDGGEQLVKKTDDLLQIYDRKGWFSCIDTK